MQDVFLAKSLRGQKILCHYDVRGGGGVRVMMFTSHTSLKYM